MRLPDISTIRTGYTARGRLETADRGGTLTIQLGDVTPDGRLDPESLTRMHLGDVPDRYFVCAGDVVFRSRGERNTACALDGRFREPALAVLPLFVLRPRRDVILPEYLAWAMNQSPAQRHFDGFARGTSLRMVPRASLDTLELDVPDIGTQLKIVTIDALAERERALSVLAADKRQTLTSLVLRQSSEGQVPQCRAGKDNKVTDQLTQQQVNQTAWAACDTFRGVIDAGQYKDYLLVMLFLRYISDLWDDHLETYRSRYSEDETRIRRRLERERFILPEGASFHDLYEQRHEADIGELINIALEKIEDANRAKLEGVFRNIDFNSEANLGRVKDRNRRLKNLLEDFAKPALDLRPSRVTEDIIGECYIYLISRFASDAGKKAGEFYTPAAVSRLLAGLAAPKPGNTICDPACGSGSLLIRAAEEVGSENFALYGQEVNGATWALARMNMFLHAKDAARIEWCDTLNSPALIEGDYLMRFDIVVANPPFSLDKWGAEDAPSDPYNRYWRGVPPKSKGDYGFITHMIEIAKRHSGRVAVIVPHGALFRGGAEGRIRKALIEENLLDAVIGLPANLFTTTGIPVAILVFDRSREEGGANEARRDVLFIDASKAFTPGKKQNVMDEEHLAKVLETYRERTVIEKYSHLANPEETAENDYNLNIPRYVDTFEPEEEIDIAAVQKEINQIETELAEVRGRMAGYLKELGVDV